MMSLGRGDSSTIGTALGALVAIIAVVGTQFLGWEWGDGHLVPTIIGVLAAAVAIVLVSRRFR